ncbi:MAG: hypothetical protein ACRC24_07210 [Vibrionaceae bacterium]
MTIGGNGNGNAAVRGMDVLGPVNNGDRFIEDRFMMQNPHHGQPTRRQITLIVRGQILNVNEHVQTRWYQTHIGIAHWIRRTFTVTSQSGAPLIGLTQPDVVSALRVYDAQAALARQQAQPCQAPQNVDILNQPEDA